MTKGTYNEHLNLTGTTFKSAKSRHDKQWNRFYYRSKSLQIKYLLEGIKSRDILIDIGASVGSWQQDLRAHGFKKIIALEIDPERARIAESAGYDEVICADVFEYDFPGSYADCIIFNNVLNCFLDVHEKASALSKASLWLQPDGCLIANHPTPTAVFGIDKYKVNGHISFMSINDFMEMVNETNRLSIVETRPTYYRWTHSNLNKPLILKALEHCIKLPLVPELMFLFDTCYSRSVLPIEMSHTVYYSMKLKHIGTSYDG